MKSHWNKKIANQYIKKYAKIKISKDLALRIYTTHLLGSEKKLVLHGGGNTSLKETQKDFFNKIFVTCNSFTRFWRGLFNYFIGLKMMLTSYPLLRHYFFLYQLYYCWRYICDNKEFIFNIIIDNIIIIRILVYHGQPLF